MIFNKEIVKIIKNKEQYLGTYFLQTHLVLESININEHTIIISKICIDGKTGNNGGFNFYEVFGVKWKDVIFKTGLACKFQKKSLDKVFNYTIRKFLSPYVRNLRLNENNYLTNGISVLFKITWKYPVAWVYLYPSILLPRFLLRRIMYLKNKSNK